MLAKPTSHKRALSQADVDAVLYRYSEAQSHDNLLFLSLFLTAFFALMQLGDLIFPDDYSIMDWRKVIRHSSVILHAGHYGFTLPAHKADHQFEGNRILVCGEQFSYAMLHHFTHYLQSRDKLFPLPSPLWLLFNGAMPTRSFFISRLNLMFGRDIAGQSMCAGSTTMLAKLGFPPHIIQAAGRWSSEAFRIYVWKSPFLLHGLLFASTYPQH